jgi:hypothetical protein
MAALYPDIGLSAEDVVVPAEHGSGAAGWEED